MRVRLARVLAATLAIFATARAEGNLRLVLVADGDEQLGRRLLAEARQAGFEVVVEPAGRAEQARELARRNHAVGVLREARPLGVELWLVGDERRSASTASFQPEKSEGDAFAVRVIEETRARIVALHLLAPEAEPPAVPVASDSVAPNVRQSRPHALDLLDVGAGLAVSKASGLGPTLQAELQARARVSARASASVLALAPLSVNRFTAPGGSGQAHVYVFGAGLHWLAFQPLAALGAELGVGGGAVWLPLRAAADAGYTSHGDQLVAGLAFTSLGLDLRLSRAVGLHAGLLAGSSLPRPVVTFAGREVAAWGHFFASGSATLELRIPN